VIADTFYLAALETLFISTTRSHAPHWRLRFPTHFALAANTWFKLEQGAVTTLTCVRHAQVTSKACRHHRTFKRLVTSAILVVRAIGLRRLNRFDFMTACTDAAISLRRSMCCCCDSGRSCSATTFARKRSRAAAWRRCDMNLRIPYPKANPINTPMIISITTKTPRYTTRRRELCAPLPGCLSHTLVDGVSFRA
jgi:hypothetical protein